MQTYNNMHFEALVSRAVKHHIVISFLHISLINMCASYMHDSQPQQPQTANADL